MTMFRKKGHPVSQDSNEHQNRRIIALLEEQVHLLKEIRNELRRPRPVTAKLKFQGDIMQIQVGQSIPVSFTEADAAGNPVPVVGSNISFTDTDASPAAVASFVDNGDGTATFTGIAPGSITVSGSDSSNGLTASDTLTVVAAGPPPDPAVSAALVWGTPQSPASLRKGDASVRTNPSPAYPAGAPAYEVGRPVPDQGKTPEQLKAEQEANVRAGLKRTY
jgi:hypothetical protein